MSQIGVMSVWASRSYYKAFEDQVPLDFLKQNERVSLSIAKYKTVAQHCCKNPWININLTSIQHLHIGMMSNSCRSIGPTDPDL